MTLNIIFSVVSFLHIACLVALACVTYSGWIVSNTFDSKVSKVSKAPHCYQKANIVLLSIRMTILVTENYTTYYSDCYNFNLFFWPWEVGQEYTCLFPGSLDSPHI